MTPWASRALRAYLIALLLLAGIGSASQRRYVEQRTLLNAKEAATIELADAHAVADRVAGPVAVGTWARAAGMVSSRLAGEIQTAAAGLAPR
jgi:hypothetical protein